MHYLSRRPIYTQSFLSIVVSDYRIIPGKPKYEIDLLTGTVRDKTTLAIIPAYLFKAAIRLYSCCKFGLVHRLVMSAAIGRTLATCEQVRHRDGDTFNNAVTNLSIGSPLENARDKIASNTNGRTLHNAAVREIRRLAANGDTRKAIARRYGVTASHVGAIINRTRWNNLS
jgi:HNH endonuclease